MQILLLITSLTTDVNKVQAEVNEMNRANARPSLEEIIRDSKWNDTLTQLSKCESGQRWHIKVMDINGKYSYGGLQFQQATFIDAIKRYNVFPDIPEEHYMDFIFSEEHQKVVAIAILDNEPQGLYHWKNCSQKLHLI